ncbi:MAG: hypothetical protein Q8O31_03760, partial [Rhodocyclaceae bacterium]|nr:hypothetical protein [Rhodocyclaceae bacterium]
DVLQNIDTVVEAIWIALQKESIPHPLPNPPLEGEGDCHVLPFMGREAIMSAIWHVTHYKPYRTHEIRQMRLNTRPPSPPSRGVLIGSLRSFDTGYSELFFLGCLVISH